MRNDWWVRGGAGRSVGSPDPPAPPPHQHRLGGLFGRFEKCLDLTSQLVLNAIDRSAGVEDAKGELVGDRGVLAEELILIGAETVVDVVAVLQVHSRFPEVHSTRLEHATDERLDVD